MEPRYRERAAEVISKQNRSVQLDYAIQHLNWLEEYDSNPNATRSLAAGILSTYAKHSDSPFFHDERIFHVSMTIGRLSRRVGLRGVMQQISDRGQFAQLAEFYIKWAEIYGAERNVEEFEKIHNLAVERKAVPHERIEEKFREMKAKYFGDAMDFIDNEQTEQLFAPKVSSALSAGNKENVKAPSPLVLGGTSFTQNFYSKAMQDFSNTLPVAPPRAVQPSINASEIPEADTTITAETAGPINFQVYRDDKMDVDEKSQKEEKSINSLRAHEFKKPDTVGHMGRAGIASGTVSTMPRPSQSSAMHSKNIPRSSQPTHGAAFLDSINEEVVSGTYVKQGKAGIAASTPANPYVPTIEEHMFDISLQQERRNDLDVIFPSGRKTLDPGQMATFDGKQTTNFGTAKCGIGKEAGPRGDLKSVAKPSFGGSLLNAVSGLTIGGDADEDDEPTGRGLRSLIQSEINPWDEKVRQKIMGTNRLLPTYLHDCATRMKRIAPGMSTVFEGEQFDVLEMIGEGGFAKVFKCNSEDGNTYAVKVESPSCRWEVYVCELIRIRLPRWMLPGVMTVHDAYIYPNMSAIVYEYHPYGNLLDLANSLNSIKTTCSGLLTVYLSWEIARIVQEVHKAQIIHGDVKPDNFMILRRLDENITAEELLNEKCFTIKLIDWGRAIDMSMLQGRTFTGRAGTECFDCFEMLDGRPWTYQTDFFGFIATMHVLLFGQYIKTTMDEKTKEYSLLTVIKRRCNQRDVLQDVFQMCMNIPDCDNLPDWNTIVKGLAESVRYSMNNDRMEWKICAREFNQAINSQARK